MSTASRSIMASTRLNNVHKRSHHMRTCKAVLVVVVACAMALCLPRTSASMMDMPDDPVNGDMVMSSVYNFELKNGQRLRFATADTLEKFVKDPSTALGEVRMMEKTSDSDSKEETMSASVLCPVCGMETAAHGGPQVLMKHGEQAIHTCSMFHAHQVHDEILSFREVSAAAPVTAEEAPFCTGSGTTMLNGFAFFQGGRVSTPCILLWFPGWILNTPWRYLGGCLTVVLCAMFNEYMLKLRRILRKESDAKRLQVQENGSGESSKLLRPRAYSASHVAPPTSTSTGKIATWFRGLSSDTQHMVHCLLHGATIMLAYMLMLVSMTYDGVLFLCCIAGYVLGYFVFGEQREAVPDADAFASA